MTPPPKKKELGESLSAEGVALTTFWSLNSITETVLRYTEQQCPLVVKMYYCHILILYFSVTNIRHSAENMMSEHLTK